MIDHISIRDFAIIDNVEVDFSDGLSIITGETGSGKSILVTAISLALGSRADSSYVRSGKDKALVQLSATLEGADGLEEIVISREVSSAGKNLCKLNGRIVTLTELAEKCKEIADIHGQYDNQSLLDPETHLGLLDEFHKEKIRPLLNSYELCYKDYLEKKRALDELLSMEEDSIKKADFYRFELNEIEKASPVLGEDEELEARLGILQNSEKIFDSANSAYQSLQGERGAYSSLGTTVDSLEHICEYSPTIQNLLEETRDIYYRLEDISSSLRDLVESMTYDPDEIDTIINRLSVLDNLKKKYSGNSGSIQGVISYRDKIKKELDQIENFDQEKSRLEKEFLASKEKLLSLGSNLTKERQRGADILRKEILNQLKDLSFQDADLKISFTPLETPSLSGLETAEILITVNVGEPLKPLSKTSSGGEISRIMLAIKSITADYDKVPTLIFDEIDQGISGKTAAIVGKKLLEISQNHQVICITHLPQIAALSDNSYRIFKESDESKTYTHIEKLKEESKVLEIARLLGGETITDTAIENAKELMKR